MSDSGLRVQSVMLRVHRVEVIFWWFKVLGNLQGTHCEYQNALDGHKSDSYAHEAVDGPRRFIYGEGSPYRYNSVVRSLQVNF